MIDRRHVLTGGLLASLAVSNGCDSPEPVLFTLEATPGPALAGGPRGVVLREIGLARYLDRPQIVRATDDYRVSIAQNDWWGEPLGRMIGRVLVADLSQRLPASMVVAESGAISARQADATAEVNILGFSADRAGNVRLSAQVAAQKGGRAADRRGRAVEITVAMADPGTKGQVAAMSLALGRLADTLAEMLQG